MFDLKKLLILISLCYTLELGTMVPPRVYWLSWEHSFNIKGTSTVFVLELKTVFVNAVLL